jgi:hypothetical protein
MFFRQIPYQYFQETRELAKDSMLVGAILNRRRLEYSGRRPRIASGAGDTKRAKGANSLL